MAKCIIITLFYRQKLPSAGGPVVFSNFSLGSVALQVIKINDKIPFFAIDTFLYVKAKMSPSEMLFSLYLGSRAFNV